MMVCNRQPVRLDIAILHGLPVHSLLLFSERSFELTGTPPGFSPRNDCGEATAIGRSRTKRASEMIRRQRGDGCLCQNHSIVTTRYLDPSTVHKPGQNFVNDVSHLRCVLFGHRCRLLGSGHVSKEIALACLKVFCSGL